MTIAGIGQYARLEISDTVLQPRQDPTLSFREILENAPPIPGVASSAGADPVTDRMSLGPGALLTAEDLRRDLAARRLAMTPELERIFAPAGAHSPVHLAVQADGSVAALDHPAKAAIDAAIAERPELGDRLRKAINLANLLHQNDEGQAYQRAYMRDPEEAAERFPEFASGEKVAKPMLLTMAVESDWFNVSFARQTSPAAQGAA